VKINDAITGAVLVIFAVAEIAYTRTFPSLHGQSYGPNLFPILIGLGLICCGLILIARGLLLKRSFNQSQSNSEGAKWIDFDNLAASSHARINASLVVMFLLIYIFLSEWVGFVPLSLITIFVLSYRLGSSVHMAIAVSVVATLVIQMLFAKVLLVPLPAGWLQGLI